MAKCKLIRSALHRVPSRLDRTMGKEAQLLEAAAAGNNIRVEVSVVLYEAIQCCT